MLKFTLDTNCLIDVEENRPQGSDVKTLVDAALKDQISLALVASSASEKQKSGDFLISFDTFDKRRAKLGFGEFEILLSIARWDATFWDKGLWANENMIKREKSIFDTLFPNDYYTWADCSKNAGISLEDKSSSIYKKWRNKLLDAQAFWAHEHNNRDVFVTSDTNFVSKLLNHQLFPSALVKTPCDAVNLQK